MRIDLSNKVFSKLAVFILNLALLFGCFNLKSQTTTYSVLSTAYNRATGTFFPLGAIDNSWFYTKIEDLVIPNNPGSVILYPNNPTYVVSNAGNNTFPGIIANHSINMAPNTSSLGLKLFTYRTYFTLPNFLITSKRYSLTFKLSGDDAVHEVRLNGTQKAQFLSSTYNNIPGINKPYMLTVPICDTDFVSGVNYIDVVVADAGGSVGYYAEVTLFEVVNPSTTQMSLTSLCNGATSSAAATITTAVTNPMVSYYWTDASGALVSQTNNTSSLTNLVNNLPNGTYTVQSQINGACGTIATETLTINCVVSATVPTASFSMPDTVCVNEVFSALNTSVGSTSQYWSFCQGNTNLPPQAANLGNIGFFNGPVFSTIAKDGTDYYAFVTNNSSSDLTKLFFGSSLLNAPIATNLGNVSGAFPNSLEDLHLEYEGGIWYGIAVGGFAGTESIVRLNFGNSLSNTPTAVNMGNIGGMNYPQRLKIFKNGSSYYGFTTNRNNNTITRFDFGNSITNLPAGLNLGNIGMLNTPDAIALINVSNAWYGYIINEGSNTLTRLDFGTSLLNIPTGTNLGNTGALNGPRAIDMWTECNEIRGLITNRFSNDLLNMTLPAGPTGAAFTSSFGNIAGFSFPHSITRFRSGDTLFAFITNVSNNTLSRIYYPGCVNASISSSTLFNPPSLSYNTPGTYYVNLLINEGQITQTNYCKQIVVVATPTIVVSSATICAGSSTSLTASGATTYSWTSPSTLSSSIGSTVIASPNITETYTITGTVASCTNSAVTTVSVIPNSTISIVGNTLVCLGQTTVLTAVGIGNFLWNTGPTTPTITVAPAVTTSYSVSTSSGSLCANTGIVTVSVMPNPTVIPSSNVSICEGTGASTTLTVTGAGSYVWNNVSTLSSSTGSMVIASPNTTTVYTVTGTTNSCSNTAMVTVSVTPAPTITATSIINTSCGLSNGSATVSVTPSASTFTWSSGILSITNTATSLAAGNYSVTVVNGSCQTNTTIAILPSTPLSIMSYTILPANCNNIGGSITVTDNQTNSTYNWSPAIATNTNSIVNLSSGTYSLTVSNGACTSLTVYSVGQLTGPTTMSITKTDIFCQRDSGSITITNVLNGTSPFEYSINNAGYSTAASYFDLSEGSHSVFVKDADGCVYGQTVTINRITEKSVLDLKIVRPGCEEIEGSFIVNSITGGTGPYLTNFNDLGYSSNFVFEPVSVGNHTLIVQDSNKCRTEFILTMTENRDDYTLYIPNTFTPNNNTVNDVWYAKGTCLNSFHCRIFNRWGEKIKELSDITEGWDGTFKGAVVPDGVYVYLIEITTDKEVANKTGHITIFR